MGYFSLLLIDLQLAKLHSRNMLCNAEWYDDSAIAKSVAPLIR